MSSPSVRCPAEQLATFSKRTQPCARFRSFPPFLCGLHSAKHIMELLRGSELQLSVGILDRLATRSPVRCAAGAVVNWPTSSSPIAVKHFTEKGPVQMRSSIGVTASSELLENGASSGSVDDLLRICKPLRVRAHGSSHICLPSAVTIAAIE